MSHDELSARFRHASRKITIVSITALSLMATWEAFVFFMLGTSEVTIAASVSAVAVLVSLCLGGLYLMQRVLVDFRKHK